MGREKYISNMCIIQNNNIGPPQLFHTSIVTHQFNWLPRRCTIHTKVGMDKVMAPQFKYFSKTRMIKNLRCTVLCTVSMGGITNFRW